MSRVLRTTAALFIALAAFAACGGDDEPSESDVSKIISTSLQEDGALSEGDADCIADAVVAELGVDGLAKIGLDSGGSGDIEDLSEEQQAELFATVGAAFGECDIDPAAIN